MHQVVMTGTSDSAGGGITSVIRLMRQMQVWKEYNIYWLATQTNGAGYLEKLWMAIKAALKAPFVMWNCKIVHFHMVPGITLLIQLPELILAKLLRKKIIMEVHVGNQLESYSKDKFFKWWFKRADLVLLLAKKWETFFKEMYSDVKVPTDVLYNACEMHEPIAFEKKKKLILFAGTIHGNKAPDLLLKAWAKLNKKYPDWHVSFLGSGNISYYEEMAKELGVKESVNFTGYINGSEKESCFHDASIYCMCSYMEGFPMTVLEAWSHSIAVVTTPVGGLPDVIDDDNNCLTFSIGDFNELAEQLERLISDNILRKRLSIEGYQQAMQKFSIEVIGDKLNSIYKRLID